MYDIMAAKKMLSSHFHNSEGFINHPEQQIILRKLFIFYDHFEKQVLYV